MARFFGKVTRLLSSLRASRRLQNLRNTTSISMVMKGGRLFNAETLDEVWPRERKLPAQYWQDVGLGAVRAGIR